MKRNQLTQDQLRKLAGKLMNRMEINGFSNDGYDVVQIGKVNGREVAIRWNIENGIHNLWMVMTETHIFTIA